MITVSIRPRDDKQKLSIPAPDDALSFEKYQDIARAINKQYTITHLDPVEDHFELVQFAVVDGQHHKFKVENVNDVWQCSCKHFVESETDHCEHIGIITAVLKHPVHFNSYPMFLSVRQQKRTSGKKDFCYMAYDGLEQQIVTYKIGRKKDAPLFKSVAVSLAEQRIVSAGSSNEWNGVAPVSDSILNEPLKLYDYQEDIFSSMLKAQKAICSMEMGSGKTLTSIACYGWIRKHLDNPRAKLLVICPKSLKLQWARELKRAISVDSLLVNDVASLGKVGEFDAHIVTYQFFSRHAEKFENQSYDMVVMDEIQFIRNSESKAWAAAKTIKAKFFFGLSGTVIENSLNDLYAIMDVIAPGHLGPAWKFKTQHQNLVSVTKKVLIFSGIKNTKELHEKLKGRVFGYNKLTLPEISHHYKAVPMSKEQVESHDAYYADAKKLLAKAMTQGLSFAERMILQSYLLKARQCCNTLELILKKDCPASPKVNAITQTIKKHGKQGKKVVLFSQWTEFLAIIARNLEEEGIGFVFYTGKESEKQREQNLKEFTINPAVQVFLASDAGGVGLDGLQHAANVVIHTELPWNPARLDQRTGRVYRIGQTKPVEVIYYYAPESIEEHILQVLQGKRDIRTITLDPSIL